MPPLDLGMDPGGTGRPEGTTFDRYRQSKNVIDVTRPWTPNGRIRDTFDAMQGNDWGLRLPYPGYTPPTRRVRDNGLELVRDAYERSTRNFRMGGPPPMFPDGPLPPVGGMSVPIPRPRPRGF